MNRNQHEHVSERERTFMVQLSCSLLKTGVNVRRPTRGVQIAKKMGFAVILMQFGGWRMRPFNRTLCKNLEIVSQV